VLLATFPEGKRGDWEETENCGQSLPTGAGNGTESGFKKTTHAGERRGPERSSMIRGKKSQGKSYLRQELLEEPDSIGAQSEATRRKQFPNLAKKFLEVEVCRLTRNKASGEERGKKKVHKGGCPTDSHGTKKEKDRV